MYESCFKIFQLVPLLKMANYVGIWMLDFHGLRLLDPITFTVCNWSTVFKIWNYSKDATHSLQAAFSHAIHQIMHKHLNLKGEKRTRHIANNKTPCLQTIGEYTCLENKKAKDFGVNANTIFWHSTCVNCLSYLLVSRDNRTGGHHNRNRCWREAVLMRLSGYWEKRKVDMKSALLFYFIRGQGRHVEARVNSRSPVTKREK